MEFGDESDLLSLRAGLLVTSPVAWRMSQIIVTSDINRIRCNQFVLKPSFVTLTEQGLTADPSMLPDLPEEEVMKITFCMVSMLQNHARLTVIDFANQSIQCYDSLPNLISSEDRNMYYVTVMSEVFQKYGTETEITPVCVPTAKEISNDCVQISWLALKAIQMCEDAEEVISVLTVCKHLPTTYTRYP
jgi:hypothetical protein